MRRFLKIKERKKKKNLKNGIKKSKKDYKRPIPVILDNCYFSCHFWPQQGARKYCCNFTTHLDVSARWHCFCRRMKYLNVVWRSCSLYWCFYRLSQPTILWVSMKTIFYNRKSTMIQRQHWSPVEERSQKLTAQAKSNFDEWPSAVFHKCLTF